ncbi:MAG: hypothetical protein EP349_07550 [Alphaproteobacteria bacterium]|nr:MAG: hypothetical protein EP349_07550 [Alphaproteobacteria bacterium]
MTSKKLTTAMLTCGLLLSAALPMEAKAQTLIITGDGSYYSSPVADKLPPVNNPQPAAPPQPQYQPQQRPQIQVQSRPQPKIDPRTQWNPAQASPRPGFQIWEYATPQQPLSPQVKQQLAQAAARGNKTLLEAVKALSYYHPEMAEAIVAEAAGLSQAMGMGAAVTTSAIAEASAVGSSGLYLSLGGAALVAGGSAALLGAAAGSGDETGGGAAAPTSSADPDFVVDLEFVLSGGLAQINADAAYSRSTGSGVITAVIDSGIMPNHADFTGRIAAGSVDYIDGGAVTTDLTGHGSHVSGIIAATRDGLGIQGVAYNSQILPLRAFADEDDPVDTNDLADAVNYAYITGNANIINNSWNTEGIFINDIADQAAFNLAFGPLSTALQNAITVGDLAVVFAAGNDDNNPEVGSISGMPLLFPALEDNWLTVVAVDNTNTIAPFSNFCGAAQAFCLAAPGVNIISTIPYDIATEDRVLDGLTAFSGTSMAAPHVSGALALLLDEFLGLTVQEAIDILLATANDGFVGYDPNIHGQGVLDLDAAFIAVGPVSIPASLSVSGAGFSAASSSLSGSPVFGSSLNAALAAAPVITLDSYNRAFAGNLGQYLHDGYDGFNASRSFLNFTREKARTVQLGEGTSLGFRTTADTETLFRNEKTGGTPALRDLRLTSAQNGYGFTAGYNAPAAQSLDGYNSYDIAAADMVIDSAVGNSYFSLFAADDNISFAGHMSWGPGTFTLGSTYGTVTGGAEDSGAAFASVAEYGLPLGEKWNSRFQIGAMTESQGLLGLAGTGAFATGRGTTGFAGIGFDYEISSGLRLIADYQYGLSSMQGAEGSLISGFDNVASDSFSIGMTGENLAAKNDHFGILFSQPLRVNAGSAHITTPAMRDAEGNITQAAQNASLTATGRELNLQTWYGLPLSEDGEDSRLKIGAAFRHQPGHIKQADAEAIGMFQLSHKF